MPTRHADHAPLTADARTRRVTALLATGLLRLGSSLSPPDLPAVHIP